MRQAIRETYREFRPLIWTLWVVAAVRLVVDSVSRDPGVTFMVSVYAAAPILFLYNGFTGALDHLRVRQLLLGFVMTGVLCWAIPNTVSYTVGQFAGWTHGRFLVVQEEMQTFERLRAEGLGFFEARTAAAEELGGWKSRSMPPAATAGGKIGVGLLMGAITAIVGALWCALTGWLLLCLPAAARRKWRA